MAQRVQTEPTAIALEYFPSLICVLFVTRPKLGEDGPF